MSAKHEIRNRLQFLMAGADEGKERAIGEILELLEKLEEKES